MKLMLLTSTKAQKSQAAEMGIERAMLITRLRNRVQNHGNRPTMEDEIMQHIAGAKWQWKGHLIRGNLDS